MEEVYRTIRRVARSNASVLLLGETGTGKELVANAVHRLSLRNNGPFVRVNCGALSENLLESELFGHVRGSFTGAVTNRTGRFEAAHGGTILLDEINSTSLHLQVKLLRVLQEREFERVGDTQTICVDTRVIAASNRELGDEVAAGIVAETGATLVHAFADAWVIEGQGSAGVEIAAQLGRAPSRLVACCGGGGLSAGLALACPDSAVHVVEPHGWDMVGQALEAGNIQPGSPVFPLPLDSGVRLLEVERQ